MKQITAFSIIAILFLQLTSCSKSNDATPAATVTWTKSVTMSTKFEVPALATRSETGTATLDLLSDNTLKYNIVVSGLASGDVITGAHIHLGNAASSGGVYIPFTVPANFSGTTLTGTTGVLTAGQIDTLKNQPAYVNVHTTQAASGLIRGQIDSKVTFAADVTMTGANEVPAVTTTATGLATIRVTEDKNIYVKVVVSNLESTDALSAAHIHSGASTVSGPVILGFYSAATDFGVVKKLALTDALYTSLLNDVIYVNAHSTTRPSGLVRGQIR
jgi:hypothetical protein